MKSVASNHKTRCKQTKRSGLVSVFWDRIENSELEERAKQGNPKKAQHSALPMAIFPFAWKRKVSFSHFFALRGIVVERGSFFWGGERNSLVANF